MFRRIYLDNSATTPADPRVVEVMLPYLTEKFGNASSIHYFGQEAKGAVDKARHQVAHLINARPNEIVFTSGGTESNNLAIRGLLKRSSDALVRMSAKHEQMVVAPSTVVTLSDSNLTGLVAADGDADGGVRVPHVITSSIEHSAVKNVCEDLEKQGVEVTYLPVYENGIIRIEDVKSSIRDETILISIMMANNEIGTLQPVEEIGQFVKELRSQGRKIWFHTDAVQAVGKIPVNVEEIGCDLLSISAHKIYAPKGVGALYVRRGVRLHPQNIGGHQERERRGGTESVPHIVAFGKACELACSEMAETAESLQKLRDRFESEVGERISDLVFNGEPTRRLPNISNISFRSIEGEGLLINLDMQGIAVSTGSACSSGSLEPSPVIRALGRNDELARGAIRFSLGRTNTEEDIERLLEILPVSIENLQKLNPAQSKKAV